MMICCLLRVPVPVPVYTTRLCRRRRDVQSTGACCIHCYQLITSLCRVYLLRPTRCCIISVSRAFPAHPYCSNVQVTLATNNSEAFSLAYIPRCYLSLTPGPRRQAALLQLRRCGGRRTGGFIRYPRILPPAIQYLPYRYILLPACHETRRSAVRPAAAFLELASKQTQG
jgi:hypothetical protein